MIRAEANGTLQRNRLCVCRIDTDHHLTIRSDMAMDTAPQRSGFQNAQRQNALGRPGALNGSGVSALDFGVYCTSIS